VRHAATVVLLREAGAHDVEIYLLRRHRANAFMGGAYVFPGGKLDPSDFEPEVLSFLGEAQVERCAALLEPTPGYDLDREQAVGLYVAACRELFEEAGVLLAKVAPSGVPWTPTDRATLSRWREGVHGGELPFLSLLTQQQARLDLDAMTYFAHWITPSGESRRFDTRFFMTRVPQGQAASLDAKETTDEVWCTPAQALLAHERREMLLAPPTFALLQELAEQVDGQRSAAANLEAMLEMARQRCTLPILPKIAMAREGGGILLPWDPGYAAADGDVLPTLPDYPEAWRRGPSRIIMVEGRWRAFSG